MSHDLRSVRPEFRDILLNYEAIQIDQDPLGIQGRRVYKVSLSSLTYLNSFFTNLLFSQENSVEIWTKPIQPVVDGANSFAVAILNKRTDGAPYWVKVSLQRIGLTNADNYLFTEAFGKVEAELISSNGTLSARIPPSGRNIFSSNKDLIIFLKSS